MKGAVAYGTRGEETGLVDPRTGVVTELRAGTLPPHLPEPLRLWLARPADTRCFTPWPGEPVTSGCAWWDDGQAQAAALGEAVERYCAALIPPGLPRATPDEMRRRGKDVIELADLALFSAAQYRTSGFPFVAFGPDLPMRWVPGRDLLTGAIRAVPIGLVFTTVHRGLADGGPYGDEPRTNPVPYAGLAAGRSHEQAELAALLELIERDAVTRSWLRGEPWPEIAVDPPLADLLRGPRGVLRVRLFLVPGAVDVPVITALIDDTSTGLLALGSAARIDPLRAALKAVAEAAQLHLMLHELDDPASAVMRLSADPGCPLRPWRADRRYRDSYRPDWRDVRDLACQLQLYLDPTMREPLLERLAVAQPVRLSSIPASTHRSATDLAHALHGIGIGTVSVDLTTDDVQVCGWRAVRVIAPGLYPNTPAAFPPLGGWRLGDSRRPVTEYPLPMPYA
ncbi:MAG TPA: YcaO-like family protein [Pseudonocardiaceae bacterium]|nr:YcaO-like family protein [Pseudonocardiaceae bacterium]